MSDLTKSNLSQNATDYVGLGLALVTFGLAIFIVLANVYLASKGKADATVTLLLNVLAITFSTVCTVWVGRWSARRENKAFIRAALRTTYGLHEGLEVAERSAVDGITRMKDRSSLPAPAIAVLWEEVIGRVLDQVRSQMRSAQATVANWQEFLPEEVQKLNQAEQQKAVALNEITLAAEQARAILRELKDFPETADTSALRTRVQALEEERAKLSASSALGLPAAGEARKLLAMGALEEAISAYSSLIATSPTVSHSLYVARARARYLAGDTAGALKDLEMAENKFPADPTIARLRNDIKTGSKPFPLPFGTVQPQWKELVERGHTALSNGTPDEALRYYKAARDAGLFAVLAAQDEAMALLALGKFSDAKRTVQRVMPLATGPFVRAQAFALIALADALSNNGENESIRSLRRSLDDLRFLGTPFRLSDSPLQYLFQSLRRKGPLTEAVTNVVRELNPLEPDTLE